MSQRRPAATLIRRLRVPSRQSHVTIGKAATGNVLIKAKMKNIRRFLSDSSMIGFANLILVLSALYGGPIVSSISFAVLVALCGLYAYLLLADAERPM